MRPRKLALLFATFLCLVLTGCWDMAEVNQLAIVNMIGFDQDPEKNLTHVYCQVVNPSGVSAQKGAGTTAPVYTYHFETKEAVDPMSRMLDVLPRKPFFDHYQALVVTERTARTGMVEQLNFLEKQPDRRATIYLFVTDSPIADVMNTYIPLEKVPGRGLRSLVDNQAFSSGKASRKSMIKNMVENMESSALTAHPIIGLSDKAVRSSSRRSQFIVANEGSLLLQGGALFKRGKMVGKLSPDRMPWFNLLNDGIEMMNQTLSIGGATVEVRAESLSVRKKIILSGGSPLLRIRLEAGLRIVSNAQKEKMTVKNVKKIESAFNARVREEIADFYQEGRRRGLDVVGIEEIIRRQRGNEWNQAKREPELWRETKLEITARSSVQTLGITIDPYMD